MGLIGTLYEDSVVSVEAYKVDADNEAVTGAGVDMLGYSGVLFIGVVGKGEVATHSIKAQQDSDSAFGTAADLLGSAKSFASAVATCGQVILDIHKPQERYVRALLTVANLTTAGPALILAIKYGPVNKPTTNMAGELHVSPAEGTA